MKLRVYAKYVEKKDGKGKFLVLDLVGKRCKVKFTQDAQADLEVKLPKENGYYIIDVKAEALSLQEAKKSDKYPTETLWIRDGLGVKAIDRDTDYEAKKALEKAAKIGNLEADDPDKDDAENIFDK